MPNMTDFRRRVYAMLMLVPSGCVTTYGTLARAVGCRSARAIGHALRENPFAPAVPCHRVIAAKGMLGGFKGQREGVALAEKRALLAAEGVHFKHGRLVDCQRLCDPLETASVFPPSSPDALRGFSV